MERGSLVIYRDAVMGDREWILVQREKDMRLRR